MPAQTDAGRAGFRHIRVIGATSSPRYSPGMKIDVSKHRAWIDAAVAAGEFASAEEAVNAALAHVEYERGVSAEDMTGRSTEALRAEIRRGLDSGPAEVWG